MLIFTAKDGCSGCRDHGTGFHYWTPHSVLSNATAPVSIMIKKRVVPHGVTKTTWRWIMIV